MPWRILFLFIGGMVLAIGLSASAAVDSSKVSVFVSYAGKDQVGQRVVALLEDLIESSSHYKMASSHEAMMKVTIASLNLDVSPPVEDRAALSTVITMRNYLSYNPGDPQTWYPIFLSSSLVVINATRADEFAGETLSRVEAALERYREDVRKYQ